MLTILPIAAAIEVLHKRGVLLSYIEDAWLVSAVRSALEAAKRAELELQKETLPAQLRPEPPKVSGG